MIQELGYNHKLEALLTKRDHQTWARIMAAHKDRFIIHDGKQVLKAEITGNLRYTAQRSSDLPVVGDWVNVVPMDEQTAIITEIHPRYSVLARQAVGKHGEQQLIAANLDYAFIVMAMGQDFNLHRLDRYVTLCISGHIEPVLLLSKSDLLAAEEVKALQQKIIHRFPLLTTFTLSKEDEESFNFLKEQMLPQKTYCFIGSSGVGKSTIINYLLGTMKLRTAETSTSNLKGRHTTTHRELYLLPGNSIVVDTPGMREVGITGDADALDSTFDALSILAKNCRFKDCRHIAESGCAVIEAVEQGVLSEDAYEHYQKLRREQERFSISEQDKRKEGKRFGKMVKEVKAYKKKYKY